MNMHLSALCLALTGALSITTLHAEPTNVTVRVVSRDAKFVGSSMGGVRVTLRDTLSGEILASGVTTGSTGDTKLLMHENGGRRAVMVDENAAAWRTTLELDEPRLVEVEAVGPLGQMQAANRVSATQWVVPGRHLDGGNGWLLELPGFAVDILAPPAHVKLQGAVTEVEVRANVVLMCGCPIEPGGLWDANAYEVLATLKRDGETVGSHALAYAGETSQFATRIPIDLPGLYEVTVFAYAAANGNTGLDRTTFFVP
ncbi:MAG: hypothetical protein AB7Q81_02835 [Gammaproteobacteria bacterium]